MALYLKFNRVYLDLSRSSILKLLKTLPRFYSQDKIANLEVDVLDDFTSQLLQKKVSKWEMEKSRLKSLIENPATFTKSNAKEKTEIEFLTIDQVTRLFQDAIDQSDNEQVIFLIKQCVTYEICPSLAVIMHALSVCSQLGDKETVIQVKKLCEKYQPEILESNSQFRHFIAEAVWINGDVLNSLKIFEEVYRENVYIRRRIRLMLKYLIVDSVANRSEAALLNLVSFSERLLVDYKDIFPLTCVWQACFLSEWFTDQCIALELLKRNTGLCKSVINRIPYVVFMSLRCHRTEVVYRLLEILLKYEMKAQYSSVLVALLDYQFRCCDLNSCSEIIRWAIDNQIDLPKEQHLKLVNLLLNEKMKTPFATLKPRLRQTPKFNLKF